MACYIFKQQPWEKHGSIKTGRWKIKKLIYAMSAIAAFSLLAPSAGFAQQGVANEVGLYMNPDGTGGSGTLW